VVCAHRARAEHDAVLVGIETVLHDDPLLTARISGAVQPLRVVLDSTLRLPLGARLLASSEGGGSVLVFTVSGASPTRRAALEAAGALVLATDADAQGRVSLPHVLDALGQRGVARLLVEGGSKVLTSFLRARAAQRAEIEVAPCFLGEPATPAVRELGVSALTLALRLAALRVERLGDGLLLRGDIVYPAQGGS
jgi:5-amino-6-(5-phosphoribosylamino)uracil reductase/diaminohydroxyphosphoribosylaminopyrimidine deaminase/5-amino-6-(5-phosphoribosylamino)uracil reductase